MFTLPAESFGKRSDSKDGRQAYCKACRNKRDFGKQNTPEAQAYKATHYKTNIDSYKARAKVNREKDPVVHAGKKKAYREANPEKVAEGKKRCVEASPEKYQETKKRYYEENKDALKAKNTNRYYGEKREEIIAKQKEYVERNYEKVMGSRKNGRIRKKANAGKNLLLKLQKQGVKIQFFNADSVSPDYKEGLIYICSNSGNLLHKVGSTFGRGVATRVSEHNGSSVYRENNEIKKRTFYGCGDGCKPDWKTTHVYLFPGIDSAELQRIENKIVHVELSKRGWHHLGQNGEWELFHADAQEIHGAINSLLFKMKH